MDTLVRLQTLRLKGRANLSALAAAWAESESDAGERLRELADQGLVEEQRGFFGLTASGEQRRAEALERERSGLDASQLARLYGEFTALNGEFKQLVTDVQLGNVEKASAPEKLAALHERFAPLAKRIAQAVTRLAPYPARFDAALDALRGGDARYLASPLLDSYHTIWFELHEELIQASSLTRAEEAAAGHGA